MPTVHGTARCQTQLSMHTYLVSGLSVGIGIINISTFVGRPSVFQTLYTMISLYQSSEELFVGGVIFLSFGFMLRKLTLEDELIAQRSYGMDSLSMSQA